jgi:hypothetical protein
LLGNLKLFERKKKEIIINNILLLVLLGFQMKC